MRGVDVRRDVDERQAGSTPGERARIVITYTPLLYFDSTRRGDARGTSTRRYRAISRPTGARQSPTVAEFWCGFFGKEEGGRRKETSEQVSLVVAWKIVKVRIAGKKQNVDSSAEWASARARGTAKCGCRNRGAAVGGKREGPALPLSLSHSHLPQPSSTSSPLGKCSCSRGGSEQPGADFVLVTQSRGSPCPLFSSSNPKTCSSPPLAAPSPPTKPDPIPPTAVRFSFHPTWLTSCSQPQPQHVERQLQAAQDGQRAQPPLRSWIG